MPTTSVRTYLVRGLLAGVAAGVVAFVVAYFLGEPGVNAAIGVEEAATHAATAASGGHGEVELVSRTIQSTVGLITALLAFGASLGGVFGIAFALAHGRLRGAGARTTAAVLAGGGFVVLTLVPFIKYPANPPAVGDPATIGRRTALYFLMVAASILFAIAAVYLPRRVRASRWDQTLAGAGVYLTLTVLAMAMLPTMNEVADTFPAAVLWSFRTGSLATSATLWTVLGLTFGALTDRATHRATNALRTPVPEPVAPAPAR